MPDIDQIKQDLMALCAKHNIYIGADENDAFIIVTSLEKPYQTLFKFTFVNPGEIDKV